MDISMKADCCEDSPPQAPPIGDWAEVDAFLRRAFRGNPIPDFPRTDRTLPSLLRLARLCEQRTAHTELVAKDHMRAAEEYRSESARLQDLLERIGVTPEQLSQSGTESLQCLASAANELDLRDTSRTAFAVRLAELSAEETELRGAVAESLRWRSTLTALREAVEKRSTEAQSVLKEADDSEKENHSGAHAARSKTAQLEVKKQQYTEQAARYRRVLSSNGYAPEIQHSRLLAQTQAIASMEQTLRRDQQLLDRFRGIPSDPAAARLANEQTQRRLESLQRKIDMHLSGE